MIPALVGAMVLLSVLDKPGVQALHGSEIMRLLASGAGFGIALVMLLGLFRSGNE